jgi:hypothetical protein
MVTNDVQSDGTVDPVLIAGYVSAVSDRVWASRLALRRILFVTTSARE